MINRLTFFLKSLSQLVKAGISLSVALTTATGYLLSTGIFDHTVIYAFTGVLLFAMSASALNQVQERNTDKLMPRTRNRPLISGAISLNASIIITIVIGIAGFLILWFFHGLLPALLGLFNLAWYNVVYTPLKYKTAFAAVPGGIVGAIPPVIGWVAGGGSLFHISSMALAVFFFMGQVPHFWLIILKYSTEYKLAGIQSITDRFSIPQLRRLVFTWAIATALSGGILAFMIILNHNFSFYFIQLCSIALIIYFISWLFKQSEYESRRAFISINLYYLLVMLIIIVDILISHR